VRWGPRRSRAAGEWQTASVREGRDKAGGKSRGGWPATQPGGARRVGPEKGSVSPSGAGTRGKGRAGPSPPNAGPCPRRRRCGASGAARKRRIKALAPPLAGPAHTGRERPSKRAEQGPTCRGAHEATRGAGREVARRGAGQRSAHTGWRGKGKGPQAAEVASTPRGRASGAACAGGTVDRRAKRREARPKARRGGPGQCSERAGAVAGLGLAAGSRGGNQGGARGTRVSTGPWSKGAANVGEGGPGRVPWGTRGVRGKSEGPGAPRCVGQESRGGGQETGRTAKERGRPKLQLAKGQGGREATGGGRGGRGVRQGHVVTGQEEKTGA